MIERGPETTPPFILADPEDIEAMYHLSRRGVGIHYESSGHMLSGAVLQRVCLGNLAEIDPEKYGPALEQFVQEQYEDSMGPQPEGHLNVPLLILLDCFDTDTPTDVPSEPLQEAYFAQLGFLRQNFLQQKGRTYLAANEDGRVN